MGRLDGDGYGDVVIGADTRGHGVGLAVVYFGGPTGIDVVSGIPINPTPDAGSFFGTSVMGIGDINGDHLGDIAIGSQGTVSIYYGRADRHFNIPDIVLSSVDTVDTLPAAAFGTHLSTPGDYNGDGYADLVVGAPGELTTADAGAGAGIGRTYVYLGGPSGVSALPTYILEAFPGFSNFGHSSACPGDVDGDGYDDLVVSSFSLSTPSGPGVVYYFRGGPAGLGLIPTSALLNSDPGFALQVSLVGPPQDLTTHRAAHSSDRCRKT